MSIILAIPVPEKIEKGLDGSRIQGEKYSFNLNPCIFK
jgi:hypothetical protein